MPTVKVPLFDTAYTNTDGVVLNDQLSYFMNGYIDELGGYHRFPGTLSLNDFGFGTGVSVDGVFYWQERNIALIVIEGKVYKMTYLAGVVTMTELTGATLNMNTPVIFTNDDTNCFMANGGRIVYTDGGTTCSYHPDSATFPAITHVAWLDGYLLVFAQGNRFFRSVVNNSLSISALGFASAESSPDIINAGHVFNNEVYIFGPKTIEVWQDDGVTPFSRVPGAAITIGTLSPYSVIKRDEGIYFLDSRRQVNMLNGRSCVEIPCPYKKEMQRLSYVFDCIGMMIEENAQSFIVFTFPTADRTFCYNLKTQKWGELGKWNIIDANYQRWIGNCAAYASTWNLNLIGGAGTSKLFNLSQTYSTDNGDIIRDCRRSGDIDYGTSKRKRCREFRLRLKRGEGAATTPQVMVRYRTNGKDWCPIRTVSLGDLGQYDIHKKIPAFGMYISRQYEFSASDGVEIVQADAEEEIDVLR